MISRRSVLILGEIYQSLFSKTKISSGSNRSSYYTRVSTEALYDFLYAQEYDAWICNHIRELPPLTNADRAVKEWVMKLHTGESTVKATSNWTWKQREQLGQRIIRDLARDILNDFHSTKIDRYTYNRIADNIKELTRNLELDGYNYKDKQLLFSESGVLDTQEEVGILQNLFIELSLGNKDVVMHHLELSEQNYVIGHWGDVITNSRNFLECVLQETAVAHSTRVNSAPLPEKTLQKPFEVRDYLQREGVLEEKEKKALAEVYGLLSDTGSHPNIAENDQARLMRNLALTFSQFVMLRLQGELKKLKP